MVMIETGDEIRVATAQIADASLRLGVPLRSFSGDLRPLLPGACISGPARPVRHSGSVDVFLEALGDAQPGDVLVIDNAGRLDEGCIGDLIVMEALAAGLAGIAIWGCHRDTAILRSLELPIFSLGACLAGPQRLDLRPTDALERARFGDLWVDRSDVVVLDDDGMVVVGERAAEVMSTACEIALIEQRQADMVAMGEPLRQQFRFPEYLAERQLRPALTFRDHLRRIGGAIEE